MPPIRSPWPPLDLYAEEDARRIIEAGYRVLEDAGLEIRSPEARSIYRKAGCIVDDASGIVRMGREIVAGHCALAPRSFVLHARNPQRNVHVGPGRGSHIATVHGSPYVSDLEGTRRYAALDDLRSVLKVSHALGVTHFRPGVPVEPTDVPVATRHLEIYRTQIELGDTPWCARGVGRVQAEDAIRMSAIEHATTPEALADRPTLMTVTNVNSPRRVDEEILENIMVMARHGQCVCVTPFTMMGAMAPVTLAGALAQQTAEVLGIVCLVQMIRPGTPSVMGLFTSNVDMRTGAPAFGTPEFVQATLAGGQIARLLGLPTRTGAPCGSPAADAQAAYETSFSLWAALMSHADLISHAVGWLEGGLTASFAKMVIDAEMLRTWSGVMTPRAVDEGELAIEAICAVPAGGHYFGAAHTLERFEQAFWRPLLSDWSNYENWRDAGSRDATDRARLLFRQALESYEPPPLDPARREAIEDYAVRRKAELEAELCA